jgi:hypothetical protein
MKMKLRTRISLKKSKKRKQENKKQLIKFFDLDDQFKALTFLTNSNPVISGILTSEITRL